MNRKGFWSQIRVKDEKKRNDEEKRRNDAAQKRMTSTGECRNKTSTEEECSRRVSRREKRVVQDDDFYYPPTSRSTNTSNMEDIDNNNNGDIIADEKEDDAINRDAKNFFLKLESTVRFEVCAVCGIDESPCNLEMLSKYMNVLNSHTCGMKYLYKNYEMQSTTAFFPIFKQNNYKIHKIIVNITIDNINIIITIIIILTFNRTISEKKKKNGALDN
jgi:hypothetical protein